MNLGTSVCEADETVVTLVAYDIYIQIFLVNVIAQDQVTPLLYRCLGLCHCQSNLSHALLCPLEYESIATVGEIRVWLRADFQSGSRVLKKVF